MSTPFIHAQSLSTLKYTAITRDSIAQMAAQFKDLCQLPSMQVAEVPASDVALRELARKNSGQLSFPSLVYRVENTELNTEGPYNAKLLYRDGLVLNSIDGQMKLKLHLMPVKITIGAQFLCKTTPERQTFIEQFITNLAEARLSFIFTIDEADGKQFAIRVKVMTDPAISSGSFTMDDENAGILHTLDFSLTLHTFVAKHGLTPVLNKLVVDAKVGNHTDLTFSRTLT